MPTFQYAGQPTRPFAPESLGHVVSRIYFVKAEMLGPRIIVTNLANEGRNDKVHEHQLPIESEYLYPLLRGEDVAPFKATPANYIVVPHRSTHPSTPVGFSKLPKLTREFFSTFQTLLKKRKKFRNFEPAVRDWHGLYSVLDATFSPYKVVWREMASGSGVIAAAVGSDTLPNGEKKIVLPDHKLAIVPCETEGEADYVAGFLNSDVTNLIVGSYAVATGISTHIMERIGLPRYSAKDARHTELAKLAKDARLKDLTEDQALRISVLAAEILGMSEEQATAVSGEITRMRA